MPLGFVPLLLSLAQGALRFLGSPQCPDPAAIQTQLRALDPAALDSQELHLVMLESRTDGVQMRSSFDEQGQLLEERLLPGPMSCTEWARFSAAVLATWETDLAVPGRSTSHAPPVAPLQTWKGPESSPPPALKDPWRWEVGFGISGSLAGNGTFALGGEVLAGLAPPHSPFGGQLILAGTGIRSLAVGDGSTNWQRFYLGLGGDGVLGRGALRLDLGAAFLFGLLSLSGKGYSESLSSLVFDPGVGVSARGLWRFAPAWSAWAQLGGAFWPKAQEAQVLAGATAYTARIPPVDFSLTLGLSFVGPSK